MNASTDTVASTLHELLVGLLARQLDLVDHEALLTAWRYWRENRSRSLARILVELNHIQPDTRRFLEALSRHHLAAHDHDVGESLAAVLSLEAVPAALQALCAVDPEIAPQMPSVMAMLHTRQVRVEPLVSTAQIPVPIEMPAQRYTVLRPLAVGGVGSVALAQDSQLHREVALKEIQPRMADDPASRERFVQEAEITGQLEHPGVVPVYSLGMHADGRPFYTMRYVQGETLHAAIQRFHKTAANRNPTQRRLEFHSLLGRFVAVCEVIAYAHARGILHRDLKPSNVLLGKYAETLVVDWGLAKKIQPASVAPESNSDLIRTTGDRDSTKTVMGQIVGTPAYMSPEQAAGQVGLLGPASDIYSLGATLYELLTGQAPFVKMTADVYLRIQRGEFPPPRQLRPDVPPPLDAICRKALALNPADRYATAQDLARDIERWLADAPVAVHRESLRERLGRWGRQHKVALAEWIALVVTALVALGINLYAMHQEREERRHAESALDTRTQELLRERARNDVARQNVRDGLMLLAATQLERRDHVRAAKTADDLVRLTQQSDDAWRAGGILAQCAKLSEKDAALAENYAARAVEFLRSAFAKGYRPETPIQDDPELAPLRARADFRELVQHVEPARQ